MTEFMATERVHQRSSNVERRWLRQWLGWLGNMAGKCLIPAIMAGMDGGGPIYRPHHPSHSTILRSTITSLLFPAIIPAISAPRTPYPTISPPRPFHRQSSPLPATSTRSEPPRCGTAAAKLSGNRSQRQLPHHDANNPNVLCSMVLRATLPWRALHQARHTWRRFQKFNYHRTSCPNVPQP